MSGVTTKCTTFFSDILSRAAVTLQNRSSSDQIHRSLNCASTAAHQATGASAQKTGSFRCDMLNCGGGGGGKSGGNAAE